MGNQASKQAEEAERAKQDKISKMLPAVGEDMEYDAARLQEQFASVVGTLTNQAAAAGRTGFTLAQDREVGGVGTTATMRAQREIFDEKADTLDIKPQKLFQGPKDYAKQVEGAYKEQELGAAAAGIAENLANVKKVSGGAAVAHGMRGSAQNTMQTAVKRLNDELQTQIAGMYNELDLMVTQYEESDTSESLIRAERADQTVRMVTSIIGSAVKLAAPFVPTG